MASDPDILCIGSVLWDVIGRTAAAMRLGSDVPGRITRLPGGVAMNIAMTLRRFGLRPALLTAIGRDAEGDELLAVCDRVAVMSRGRLRAVRDAADWTEEQIMAQAIGGDSVDDG